MTDQFENPEYFWLLLILPLLGFWMWYSQNKKLAEFSFPGAEEIARSKNNVLAYLHYLPNLLRLSAIALVIIGMARPRTTEETSKTKSSEGIDIVLEYFMIASKRGLSKAFSSVDYQANSISWPIFYKV